MRPFLLFIALSIIYHNATGADDQYNVDFQFSLFRNKTLTLGCHYGKKIVFEDSIEFDHEGKASVVLGHEGIYFLEMPDSGAYEFMLCGPGRYLIKHDLHGSIEISGNKTSEDFSHYIDEIAYYSSKNLSGKKIPDYREITDSLTRAFAYKHTSTLAGNYALAILPVEFPEFSTESIGIKDKIQYYRNHYFDNITFHDPGLIYTPILEEKIIGFLKINDSAIHAIDYILQRPASEKVRNFIFEVLFNIYEKGKNSPSGEQVYLYLSRKFIQHARNSGANARSLSRVEDEIMQLEKVAYGKRAPEIKIIDIRNIPRSIHHDSTSRETILLFWDLSCADCRRVLSDLKSTVSKYHYLYLRVVTVYTGNDVELWAAWYYRNLPVTWLNTRVDQPGSAEEVYGIKSIPAIFILDNEKKILLKYITIPELDNYLIQHTAQ